MMEKYILIFLELMESIIKYFEKLQKKKCEFQEYFMILKQLGW